MVWGVMLLGFMGCQWWKVSSSLGCGVMLLAELSHTSLCFPKPWVLQAGAEVQEELWQLPRVLLVPLGGVGGARGELWGFP